MDKSERLVMQVVLTSPDVLILWKWWLCLMRELSALQTHWVEKSTQGPAMWSFLCYVAEQSAEQDVELASEIRWI